MFEKKYKKQLLEGLAENLPLNREKIDELSLHNPTVHAALTHYKRGVLASYEQSLILMVLILADQVKSQHDQMVDILQSGRVVYSLKGDKK